MVLLGEGRVGKTSLLLRYVKDSFSDSQAPTVQATYLSKTVKLENDARVTLNVWDTAGQERFHALGPIFIEMRTRRCWCTTSRTRIRSRG